MRHWIEDAVMEAVELVCGDRVPKKRDARLVRAAMIEVLADAGCLIRHAGSVFFWHPRDGWMPEIGSGFPRWAADRGLAWIVEVSGWWVDSPAEQAA